MSLLGLRAGGLKLGFTPSEQQAESVELLAEGGAECPRDPNIDGGLAEWLLGEVHSAVS